MKKGTCSVLADPSSYSCYTEKELKVLKREYNKTYRRKITSSSGKAIWKDLATLLPCKNESCFSKTLKVKTTSFAPPAPDSWKKNPREWLSSMEFLSLYKQYEQAFPQVRFYGPSAADYDYKMENGKCEFDDMCTLDVRTLPREVKQLAAIFNIDTHEKGGSHWVALFVSIRKKEVYYFDSAGSRITSHIKRFYEQIHSQDPAYKFYENAPIAHQRGTSECGIYAIFFILVMIRTENFSYFLEKRWKDSTMLALRRKLFDF